MSLLTIFSAPKSFIDPHINVIQRNAIQSWLHLGTDVEVLLIGEEPGMREVATEYNVHQLPNVARNHAGTPLVSSIFDLARHASRSPLLAYLNADILLLPDFITAAKLVNHQLDYFLMIGQRWDLDVRDLLDFSYGWEQHLCSDVGARGQMHLPAGSDYFLFSRSQFVEMPDFAIGRAGWDNWMIYYARQKGWPVIDGTPSIMAIHQDHDYRHLPGGRPHYEQPESRQNEALAGGSSNLYMVLDSDRQLRNGNITRPKITLLRILRRTEVLLTPPNGERHGLRWSLARRARRLRRKLTGSL
jgi:hypothetical protein